MGTKSKVPSETRKGRKESFAFKPDNFLMIIIIHIINIVQRAIASHQTSICLFYNSNVNQIQKF